MVEEAQIKVTNKSYAIKVTIFVSQSSHGLLSDASDAMLALGDCSKNSSLQKATEMHFRHRGALWHLLNRYPIVGKHNINNK